VNFDIRNLWVLNLGGFEIWITETMRNTWVVCGVLIALAIAVRVCLKKFQDIPKGFQNVMEALVEMFDKFVRSSAGDKMYHLGYWYFTAFSFILLANLSGLFGLRPPTADWVTTFGLALVTFGLIQVMGWKYRRGAYLRSIFLEPHWAFSPLNVIGEIARPISLSFRLFGNILAGMVIMNLLYGMAPTFTLILIPSALHFYFDVFAGVLHTYIFSVLSLTFVGIAAEA
jgi:F-type H+-transporting ATPase subunit a